MQNISIPEVQQRDRVHSWGEASIICSCESMPNWKLKYQSDRLHVQNTFLLWRRISEMKLSVFTLWLPSTFCFYIMLCKITVWLSTCVLLTANRWKITFGNNADFHLTLGSVRVSDLGFYFSFFPKSSYGIHQITHKLKNISDADDNDYI